MPRNHLLLAITATVLVACSPLPRQGEALRTATVCCNSISELPIAGRLEVAPATFEITEQTRLFDFPQGRSYFAAVGIKPGTRRKLELRTWNRGNTKLDEQIFCPVLTLLDANKQMIRTMELGTMEFTRAGLIESASFSQVVELPETAEYVVVHSPADMLGHNLVARLSQPGRMAMVGSSAYFTPGSDFVRARCGQQGRVTLVLHDS